MLVTGGAGYIGSHMVYGLIERGENVVVVDNFSTGTPGLLPQSVRMYEGDIGDDVLIARIIDENKIQSVIHFAGSVIVSQSVIDPVSYYKNNTCKTLALLDTALQRGVKHFVFSSSAAVYGMPEILPVKETAPTYPVSPYGNSKLMVEQVLADMGKASDLKHASLRYFNVAGADARGRTGQNSSTVTHLIKAACQVALGYAPQLNVYGTDYPTLDGTCIRDYIHVSDLVDAHCLVLDNLRKGGQGNVFNVGYGRGYSVLEVIAAVKKVSGKDFKVVFGERRKGDPPQLVACVNRLKHDLGWKPKVDDLELVISHALAWEKLSANSIDKVEPGQR